MVGKIKFSHFNFYLLVLIAASLPLSIFTISLFTILLTLYWIIEGNFKEKFHILRSRKSLLIFISIYFIHLIGLIWTTDFAYAFKDLRIKLPMLILPLVIGTSKPLSENQIKYLIYIFISAVIVGSLVSLLVLFGFTSFLVDDIRDISILVSHIRFSILINIAIYSGLFYILYHFKELSLKEKIFLVIAIIWLSIFLLVLKSFTGIVIYVVIGYLTLIVGSFWIKDKTAKIIIKLCLIAAPVFIFSYLLYAVFSFYNTEELNYDELEKYTVNGNYYHHFKVHGIENGNYTWIYICERELIKEWNKRSEFSFLGKDKKGQDIKYTLIRYLTSKGLRKDSLGISVLTEDDIVNIEAGNANYIYENKLKFYPRVYEIIWEIDRYIHGHNPSGHSVTQRLEYLKTALYIIKDNFWIGTGTGDVAVSYRNKYNEIQSRLSLSWRLRAHNQLVTFFLTFGIIGFVWIIFASVYPVIYEKKYNDYLFMMIYVIFGLSMLNEDTIETHVGVSMVAFFYALFLFGRENKQIIRK